MLSVFPITNTWMRYAVLHHTGHPGKQDHFDIMLELTQGEDPEDIALDKLACNDIDPHEIAADPQYMVRRRYLRYEGDMPGGRGRVRRVDEGEYMLMDDGRLVFRGRILNGVYACRDAGEKVIIARL